MNGSDSAWNNRATMIFSKIEYLCWAQLHVLGHCDESLIMLTGRENSCDKSHQWELLCPLKRNQNVTVRQKRDEVVAYFLEGKTPSRLRLMHAPLKYNWAPVMARITYPRSSKVLKIYVTPEKIARASPGQRSIWSRISSRGNLIGVWFRLIVLTVFQINSNIRLNCRAWNPLVGCWNCIPVLSPLKCFHTRVRQGRLREDLLILTSDLLNKQNAKRTPKLIWSLIKAD